MPPVNWHLVPSTNWMGALPVNLPLSEITIPGAHDCTTQAVEPENPTLMRTLNLFGYLDNVKCQNNDITGLLNMGVRYLDLRLYAQPPAAAGVPPQLLCVHGAGTFRHYCVDAGGARITFQDVQIACQVFLAAHPTETIIVCIKDEEPNAQPFEATLQALMNPPPPAPPVPWLFGNVIPTLAAARGHMVLLRRYTSALPIPQGIDLAAWDTARAQAGANGIYSVPDAANERAVIQDNFSFKGSSAASVGTSKWNHYVLPAMNTFHLRFPLMRNIPCINMTSATNYTGVHAIADTLNPLLTTHCVSLANTGPYGWMAGDYVDAAYCRAVFSMNV